MAAAENPLLRNAIPIIVANLDADYQGTGKSENWGGAHYALVRVGTKDGAGNPVGVDFALADTLVNQFCWLFIKTYPDLMMQYAQRTMLSYLRNASGEPAAAGLLTTMYDAHLGALRFARDTSGDSPVGLAGTIIKRKNAEMFAGYERLQSSRYIGFAKRVSDLYLVVAIIVFVVAGVLTRRIDRQIAMCVVAGFMTLGFYLAVISLLLAYISRYVLPYQLLLVLMLGLVVARLFERPSSALAAGSATSQQRDVVLRGGGGRIS